MIWSDSAVQRRLFVRKFLPLGLVLVIASAGASAQVSVYSEQGKLFRAPNAVATLGNDLFGDKVNLYTGGLEFVQTDVSLRGNNALPVSVGRRLKAGTNALEGGLFGRWDLDIPHLHGTFSQLRKWSASGATAGARCSSFGAPPTVSGSSGSPSTWAGTEYWNGSFLYVPGVGDQELLKRSASYTEQPADGFTYPVVTRDHWAVRCLPAMAAGNPEPGEAFVAVSPDGTRYQFDWLVWRNIPQISKTGPGPESAAAAGPPIAASSETSDGVTNATDNVTTAAPVAPSIIQGNVLNRVEVWILPTKVTDRFGNTVTYTYDTTNRWKLRSIVSSDGPAGSPRTITLSYTTPSLTEGNLVTAVSDGTHTWTYAYDGTLPHSNLTTVTQPDGATWKLAGITPLLNNIDYLGNGSCESPGVLNPYVLNGYMEHPSGARADFTLTPTSHGRSQVPRNCRYDVNAETEIPFYPYLFDTYALTSKKLSGPGLATLEWKTNYPTATPSWDTCPTCPSSKTVEVVQPDGAVTKHTFGTKFQATEGQLENTENLETDGSVLRTTALQYGRALASAVGTSDQRRGDGFLAAEPIVVNLRVINQQGVDFRLATSGFTLPFGWPTTVVRSSSIGESRTETTTFKDNLPKWVLGQVEKVTTTVNTVPVVMLENFYNSTTATLQSSNRFGKPERTWTYNADGTVATTSDGKSQTTTFTNHKRGIAQNVRHHDASTQTFVVNNNGTIASHTNQAGFTTSFGYDGMRRLGSIVYPAADTVAWTPTSIVYTIVGNAEFDLPAGHWKRQETTGNARTNIYYDALLRPVYTETLDLSTPSTTSRIVKRNYDHDGRVIYTAYPKRTSGEIGDAVYQEYDGLGRPTVTSTISELGTIFSGYNYETGFKSNFTDGRGNGTKYSYQVFDVPSEEAISSFTAPEGVNVAIVRDIFGKPRSITRSGNGKSATRSYVYDGFELLCKTIEPETGSTVQTYDAANNLAWRATGLALPSTTTCDTTSSAVTAATKVTFGYDTLNRLTSTTFGDGSPAITRTYTPDGLPQTLTSNGSVWTYSYNKRRLNTRESLAYGGATYNIDHGYDANASRSSLTYPDGSTIAYAPNALGEVTRVGNYATAVTYHPNGAVASFLYGNGIQHTMTQNVRGLPEWSIDAGVLRDNYNYDQNANVMSILDWHEGVSNRENTYDNLDRLTKVVSAAQWGTASYTYDALDNLTSTNLVSGATARATTHTYNTVTNRLTNIASSDPTYNLALDYDTRGNVTKRGAQAFVFDRGNRMSSASGKGTYVYDGAGRRVSTVGADGVNRVTVYSQEGKLLFFRATSTPIAAGVKYIHLRNHVIADSSPAGTAYSHTDGLGSPVAITDGNRALVSRTRYEPYGLTSSGVSPTIGYTGHLNAADIGLVYMQQRYYDPVAARFMSIDPVTTDETAGGSFNRYSYANNSPYKYVDPDGRSWVHVGRGAALGAQLGSVGGPWGAAAGAVILGGATLWLGDQAINALMSSVGGNRGSPMDIAHGTNPPTTIGGRDYSGHSQDRMQGRGVPSSAVEETIKNGTATGGRGDTTVYTDSKNGVQVVVNADGKVVTVKHVPRDPSGGNSGEKTDEKPKEPGEAAQRNE